MSTDTELPLTSQQPQQLQPPHISDNALKLLFSLNYTSKESFTINVILQIIHIAKYDDSSSDSNKQIFTATLSDSTHKYNGFVFIKESQSIHLEVSSLINILQVSPIICANQPCRVFVVKKFAYLDIQLPLLDTTLVKDDKGQASFEAEDELLLEEDFERIRSEMNIYTPLKQLSTFSKEFRVFVGILSKSERKFYNSSQGNPGSLFSFIVIDEERTQMEVTCFNQAIDKFYDLIKVNHTYEIGDCSVRRAQKNYNTYLTTEYKMVLESDSSVIEKEDEDKVISLPSTKNTMISAIASLPLYCLVNLLCLVIEEGERIMKKTKSGERAMRIITVTDSSFFKIELTLWGNFTNQPLTKGQILQLNGVKIGDFNGRNISTVNESHISINPNTSEANELRAALTAFTGQLKDVSIDSNNNNKSIMKEMSELNALNSKRVEFITEVLESIDDVVESANMTRVKGTITRLTHNDKNFYPGCPERNCKKKLTQSFNEWICSNCNKKYSKPTFYFTLSLKIKDCSCEHWIDVFGKTAENFLKLTAEEYKNALYSRESTKLKDISNDIEFKDFIFVIKPKIQMFNSMPKKKLQVYRIDPVNKRDYASRLIVDIKSALQV